MAVFKRFKGKRLARNDKNWSRARWVAEGQINGVRYLKSLPLARTAKEAQDEEYQIRAAIYAGDLTTLNKRSFSEFVDSVYWPIVEQENRSLKVKRTEVEQIKSFFRATPLRSINVALCERFKGFRAKQFKVCQACLHKKPHDCRPEFVATSTVNRLLTTLSRILQVAVHHKEIKENPMKFVGKLREPESRARYLKEDEKRELLQILATNEQLLAIVLIALMTGWRKGQILSLSSAAMDAETKTVLLTRSKQQKPRRVPVSDSCWTILERLATLNGEWLFPSTKGGHLKDFAKPWKLSLQKAGIKDFHFHDLRRSAATELLRLGTDAFTIRDVLGHSNIETSSIYARPQDKAMRDALNKASEGLEEWVN